MYYKFIYSVLPREICFFTYLLFLFRQRSEDDVSQFDTRFTRQIPVDSPDETTLSESANLIFQVS